MAQSQNASVNVLREDVAPYHLIARPHRRHERNAPIARTARRTPATEVHGIPVLGGLHHSYRAVA